MDRQEAIQLLKELFNTQSINPYSVNFNKNVSGGYEFIIKNDYNSTALRAFLADKDLILHEDQKKLTCKICKL